ncbi:outer membrane protein assembly factor BamE [Ancylobacter polymorphus]|uniref:Outer membrane protein assembly factor BamE (Lipoprotein component of BamABCDE complex) n=1 Tax=Ancylobacter polymorphus TaxID=223390 RepID=A0ABU0B613_9HYPH|nr:outer membrane protein assembly factor BamE [Ancylobacter polymorphus]MDQ0301260.1 outer membrane protein assembly factor BamE (lipoprotein component of BamABCDE complex) [Ancylobacter polymorphus]
MASTRATRNKAPGTRMATWASIAVAGVGVVGLTACSGDMPMATANMGLPRTPTGFVQERQRGYVIAPEALQQVPIGSSQEQVLLVLGTPSTIATVDGEVFYYISQKAKKVMFLRPEIVDQRVIAVYFDPKDKRVTRIADYGLKDGKVFDFISRTTPTGGSEVSLVGQIFNATNFRPGI